MAAIGRFDSLRTGFATRQIYWLVGVFALITGGLLLLLYVQSSVLGGVRAYVQGEGLWAKAQKDAVYHLARYARTGEGDHYRQFRKSLELPAGDRSARQALEMRPPEHERARRSLLQAGHDPADVDAMVRLFAWFGDSESIGAATEVWRRGDQLLERLESLGNRVREQIRAGQPQPQRLDAILEQVDRLNEELTRLENRFSQLLSTGARQLSRSVMIGSLIGSATLLVVGLGVASGIALRMARAHDQLRMAAAVWDVSGEGILVADRDGVVTSVNHAFSRMTGYSGEQIVGCTPRVLQSGLMSPEFYRGMWQAIDANDFWEGEVLDRRASGELLPLWLRISVVRDSRGRKSHYIALFSDISERKAQENRLRYQAHHDSLTGLPNRVLLYDRLGQAVARAERHGTQLAVLFIDLDGFKPVNDTFGHRVGDQMLQNTAERLDEAVRAGDTVCRLGGDEFVVLLEDIETPEAAAEVARKVVQRISAPHQIEDAKVSVTPSVGICLYPDDVNDADGLIHRADAAMYRAKQVGGGDFAFCDEATLAGDSTETGSRSS